MEWRESERSFLFPGNGRMGCFSESSFLTIALDFADGFKLEWLWTQKNLLFFLNF